MHKLYKNEYWKNISYWSTGKLLQLLSKLKLKRFFKSYIKTITEKDLKC